MATDEPKVVDLTQLPPHACQYCGVSNPKHVIKCNHPNCQKWFCNSILATAGSHIVNHLVRSHHKEVSLHPASTLGDTTFECYNCGNRNVFLLGFIPADTEPIVVLLCREPCLRHASQIRDVQLDSSLWQPLIENRAFLSWLVPDVDPNDVVRTITAEQVSKLEELWKSTPAAKIEDLEQPGVDDEPTPVMLNYQNASHYKSVFGPLVKIESEYDRQVKESQHQDNVSVRWDVGLNKKRLGYFIFSKENNESRLVIGDELKLRYKCTDGKEWKCSGHVAKLTQSEEVCLELKCNAATRGPWAENITTGFIVEFVWKATSFTRMLEAMNTLERDETSVSNVLYHKILGHPTDDILIRTPIPTNISAPNLAQLNHSQHSAVTRALQSPLCIIQGPPGAGKTLTSATIVYHLCRLNAVTATGGQVLVTAPSNVAVDQLSEMINRTGLKVVRVYAKGRESIASSVDFLALHKQLDQLASSGDPRWSDLANLFKLKQEYGELSQTDEQKLTNVRKAAEYEILSCADVICCTCVGAGDKRLKKFRFKQVLVDEATQATEPECLIPIVRGVKQAILVGDHCQLGPVIMCKKAAKAGLSQSLFERMVHLGTRPIRLEVQYRMHPCLSQFPSSAFYEGSLQNGVTTKERTYTSWTRDFPWPSLATPMFFYHSSGREEISASGTSYLNRAEAQNVEKIVNFMMQCGIKPHQIGIVTPYDGQRAFITTMLARSSGLNPSCYQSIEVASVDAFQGREKDFIILSCARSNEGIGIGFLHDSRRLNVALTRARYGLIICGDAKVLSKKHHRFQSMIWAHLLFHYQNMQLIVEGPLSNLKPVSFSIPPPARNDRPIRRHPEG
ncbi:MAG: uncharacterized protein KVP18_001947 [Porospora cf. gigantea A]|uniref:uncharacterized protein n=3 Tax=Porospora cf. gigantea A TaxID=2853593 RepID=UPI00355A129E|nr:MAG: hypothetical protein KVP18_001947 [Porospora cf. gigantea A]